jgi:hypothetical protein
MGNTLMCSHFAQRGESSAVNVQLIGIASNLLVLSQVCMDWVWFICVWVKGSGTCNRLQHFAVVLSQGYLLPT